MAKDCMGYRIALERNLHHILFGAFNCLLYGNRRLGCFTFANADFAFSVAYDHESAEVEPLATLNDLGHTVQVHQFIL
jgi:hypothetical protein